MQPGSVSIGPHLSFSPSEREAWQGAELSPPRFWTAHRRVSSMHHAGMQAMIRQTAPTLRRNIKCEILWPRKQWKSNDSFCLQTEFIVYFKTDHNPITEFCDTHLFTAAACSLQRFLLGMTEAIQPFDSSLNTIFFSQIEPHACHQQDWVWAAENS